MHTIAGVQQKHTQLSCQIKQTLSHSHSTKPIYLLNLAYFRPYKRAGRGGYQQTARWPTHAPSWVPTNSVEVLACCGESTQSMLPPTEHLHKAQTLLILNNFCVFEWLSDKTLNNKCISTDPPYLRVFNLHCVMDLYALDPHNTVQYSISLQSVCFSVCWCG